MTRIIAGYPGSREPVLTEITLPALGAHQALVEIVASGLCQSQINQLDNLGRAAPGTAGRLLGHEALGIVVETGPKVSVVKPGESVIMSWLPRAELLAGRQVEGVSVTVNGHELATPDIFTWAERSVADEAYLYPTQSKHLAMSVLGCAVVTGAGAVMNSARIRPGESVAVIGAGGVGGSAIVAARLLGAREIFAVDLSDEKLAFAKQLGATKVINSAREPLGEVVAAWCAESWFSGVDHVIDCVAAPATFKDALTIVRKGRAGYGAGGNVVVVGVAHRPAELDLRFLQLHGIAVKGSFGGELQGDADIATYTGWIEEEAVELRSLVTHSYGLDEMQRAVDDLRSGRITGRGVFII